MALKIALVGNPNCGKTTAFNALTGGKEYVGNRPGVTVEEKTGRLKTHKCASIIDLPGIYSLSPYSPEEKVSREYLLEKSPDAIINLLDASNIERSLYLTLGILELGIPTVVALNMTDIVKKQGDKIDIKKLEFRLGCPVVELSALKQTGLSELSTIAVNTAKEQVYPKSNFRFSPVVQTALDKISEIISPFIDDKNLKRITSEIFMRDISAPNGADIDKIENIIEACEKTLDDESDSIIIGERYNIIEHIVSDCVAHGKTGISFSSRIDSVMTNRFFALPIFALIMCAVYYISVSVVGGAVTDKFSEVVEWICEAVRIMLNDLGVASWLTGLISDGIISGVGSVLSFVPQLAVLFLFLALLEDCGYMTRIAFIMDRVFRRFGLSGKSFIPLLVASGCGVPAIMSTRTIENENDRRITAMVTTFIPCGAKLPIIALISGALFNSSALIAISVYFIGIAMVLISGLILKKFRFFSSKAAPFIMEMPRYRTPKAANVAREVWNDLRAFITKAGTIILLACVVIWFCSNFSPSLKMVGPDDSILAAVGGFIAPLFKPLGFGFWQAAVASLTGIAAKENIVSSLNILYGFSNVSDFASVFTPASGYSFLIFNMLCSPCIAAITALSRELKSIKYTLFALFYQTAAAYVCSFVIFNILTLF